MRTKLALLSVLTALLALISPAVAHATSSPQDPHPTVATTCFYGPNLGYRVYLTIVQPADVRVGRADGTVRDYGVLYAGTSSYWFSEQDISPATTLDVRWTDSTGYVNDYMFDIRRYSACHYYPSYNG